MGHWAKEEILVDPASLAGFFFRLNLITGARHVGPLSPLLSNIVLMGERGKGLAVPS